MSRFIERELKFCLESEGFERLLAEPLGEHVRTVQQENLYFDDVDFSLARSKSILRLRRTASGAVLTLKRGGETSAGYFEAEEFESPLDAETVEALLAGELDPANIDASISERLSLDYDSPELVVAGAMHTERFVFEGEFCVELDRVRDGENTSYELEIETDRPDEARAWIECELRQREVSFEAESRTKFRRFLERRGVHFEV